VSMLEAYDLVPVVNCLKSGSTADAVQACFDTISPWFAITDEGDVVFSEAARAGFTGGTIGVLGTVISTFIKRDEVKDRLKCPYCGGSGFIPCGTCCGRGTLMILDSAEGEEPRWREEPCPDCEGTGDILCINCQGSGVSVPEEFLQKLGDTETGFTEEDWIGLFDEVKFPTVDRPAATPTDEPARETTPVGIVVAKKSAKAELQDGSPVDYTGGLG